MFFLLIFRYYRKTKKCCRARIGNESAELLTKIKQHSLLDWRLIRTIQYEDYNWRLIKTIQYEDYIIWSYPNLKKNEVFTLINHQICFTRNNGLPKGILFIVEFVNKITYFNKKIKHFHSVLSWTIELFMYYHRYYRYLNNEKLLTQRKFLNYRNGHKTHFISYLKKRELTGCKLNKNHMVF